MQSTEVPGIQCACIRDTGKVTSKTFHAAIGSRDQRLFLATAKRDRTGEARFENGGVAFLLVLLVRTKLCACVCLTFFSFSSLSLPAGWLQLPIRHFQPHFQTELMCACKSPICIVLAFGRTGADFEHMSPVDSTMEWSPNSEKLHFGVTHLVSYFSWRIACHGCRQPEVGTDGWPVFL